VPKRSPKIGCGPFGARTLFSGFSKLFRDLPNIFTGGEAGVDTYLRQYKPKTRRMPENAAGAERSPQRPLHALFGGCPFKSPGCW